MRCAINTKERRGRRRTGVDQCPPGTPSSHPISLARWFDWFRARPVYSNRFFQVQCRKKTVINAAKREKKWEQSRVHARGYRSRAGAPERKTFNCSFLPLIIPFPGFHCSFCYWSLRLLLEMPLVFNWRVRNMHTRQPLCKKWHIFILSHVLCREICFCMHRVVVINTFWSIVMLYHECPRLFGISWAKYVLR